MKNIEKPTIFLKNGGVDQLINASNQIILIISTV